MTTGVLLMSRKSYLFISYFASRNYEVVSSSYIINFHVWLIFMYTCANSHYVHTCIDIVVTTEYIHEHLSTAISQELQDCTLKGWRPSCGGPDQLDSPSSEHDVISMRGSKSLLTVVHHCIYAHASSVSITAILINIMKGAYSQPIKGLQDWSNKSKIELRRTDRFWIHYGSS